MIARITDENANTTRAGVRGVLEKGQQVVVTPKEGQGEKSICNILTRPTKIRRLNSISGRKGPATQFMAEDVETGEVKTFTVADN